MILECLCRVGETVRSAGATLERTHVITQQDIDCRRACRGGSNSGCAQFRSSRLFPQLRHRKQIDFRMKDGQVWRNHLKTSCPGLNFNGFAYVLRGTDEICDNLFSIRVLKTGEVCLLGNFTRA
jgi:hypothetical protein